MSAEVNIGVVEADTGCQEEYAAPSAKGKGLRERLGLNEDRIGPIPGGLAAWFGSALFWTLLVWAVFG